MPSDRLPVPSRSLAAYRALHVNVGALEPFSEQELLSQVLDGVITAKRELHGANLSIIGTKGRIAYGG